MHIGILQPGHTPAELRGSRGDFDAMFARLLDGHGFTFTAWDVEGMDFPPGPEAADGWLITGSRHGVYEEHAFLPPLRDFIRAAHEAAVPLVGIGFGHQVIAQALGGRVEKFAGGWALGRTQYTLAEGGTLALNAWHQDQVLTPPEGAQTLAGNEFCRHAVLAYGDRAFTVQPHPEFDAPLLGDYVALRRGTGTYPDDRMEAAAVGIPAPLDDGRMAAAIARFFLERKALV